MNPDYILISPGPGNPDTAGICLDVVKTFYQEIPILGVCLGHQIIAQAFGGIVRKATTTDAWKNSHSLIMIKSKSFKNIPHLFRSQDIIP